MVGENGGGVDDVYFIRLENILVAGVSESELSLECEI